MGVASILAQIAGIISWLLLIYSYYRDDIDELLLVQIIASVFDCLSYLLLGAFSGLFVCVLELLKGIGYYKTDKDNLIFLISLPMYCIMMFFAYDSWISLLPIVGSIIDGFSLTKNKHIATIGCIIANLLWVIYDITIGAYTVALTDSIIIISNISILLFGYSMLLKSNKLRFVMSRSFSKNIYNAISKLDKKTYGEEYVWPYEYEKEINKKNETSLLMIKYHNEIVGYMNYVILNDEEFNKLINSKKIIKTYNVDNVVKFRKTKNNYLVIDSINIESKFQNKVAIDLISKRIKKLIIESYKDGYKIESILSVAVNKFEKEVLEKLGFIEYKKYCNEEILYLLDNKQIEELYAKETRKKEYYKYKVFEGDKITEDMIKDIKYLDNKFYKEEYLWDEDYQISLFNKNKNSMIMVKYENKLIGYLNYLVITEDKYNKIKNSDYTIDDFELDEITKFYKTKKNYLTLNSVVIDKKFQDGYTVKLLTKRLKKIINKMNNNNYKISGIIAIAVSKDGRKFLENLKFNKIKELKDGNVLYELKN